MPPFKSAHAIQIGIEMICTQQMNNGKNWFECSGDNSIDGEFDFEIKTLLFRNKSDWYYLKGVSHLHLTHFKIPKSMFNEKTYPLLFTQSKYFFGDMKICFNQFVKIKRFFKNIFAQSTTQLYSKANLNNPRFTESALWSQ